MDITHTPEYILAALIAACLILALFDGLNRLFSKPKPQLETADETRKRLFPAGMQFKAVQVNGDGKEPRVFQIDFLGSEATDQKGFFKNFLITYYLTGDECKNIHSALGQCIQYHKFFERPLDHDAADQSRTLAKLVNSGGKAHFEAAENGGDDVSRWADDGEFGG